MPRRLVLCPTLYPASTPTLATVVGLEAYVDEARCENESPTAWFFPGAPARPYRRPDIITLGQVLFGVNVAEIKRLASVREVGPK